jgi:hypothetical protein
MKKLEALQEEYQSALDECPTNHDNVDYYGEVIRKPHLFPSEYPAKWKIFYHLYYRVRVVLLGYTWLLMPAAAGIVITIAVYQYVIAGSTPFAGR